MIEIIKGEVDMPELSKRRFRKDFNGKKWMVIDTSENKMVYKSNFENVAIACHNLNKKFYSK